MNGTIRKLLIVLTAVALASGGFMAGRWSVSGRASIGDTVGRRTANNTYQFIHPLLGAGTEQSESSAYADLQQRMTTAISAATQDGEITEASVYFRDFKKNQWTGVNEDSAYDPASLLKVPIAMAYFKDAETDPAVLRRELTYPPSRAGVFHTLIPGRRYGVMELIRAMILKSDNGAKDALVDSLNVGILRGLFKDLGVASPADSSHDYRISAKTYALFFRLLYNGTFLNRDDSEELLGLLAETAFDHGLAAGLPVHVPVAHKFGQYLVTDRGAAEAIELHDCGIIYALDPYVLCVMTKGNDFSVLERFISRISALVYHQVTQ